MCIRQSISKFNTGAFFNEIERYAANNNLRGTIPSEIQNFHYLEELLLDNNAFLYGSIQNELDSLDNIKELNLNNTNVTVVLTVPCYDQYLTVIQKSQYFYSKLWRTGKNGKITICVFYFVSSSFQFLSKKCMQTHTITDK